MGSTRLISVLGVLLATTAALPLLNGDPCSYQSGNLSVQWKVDVSGKSVHFSLEAPAAQDDYWTGVFFGDEKPTDAVIAFIKSGQFGHLDGHIVGDEIVADTTNNLELAQSGAPNGEGQSFRVEFSRPIEASDQDDANFTGCTTFFFPSGVLPISSGGNFLIPDDVESFKVCELTATCQESIPEKLEKEEQLELVKRDGAAGAPVCDWSDGASSIHWASAKKGVRFSVSTEAKKGKYWSAIGVGESMSDLKLAVVFTDGGKVKQSGGYKSSGYAPPAKDKTLKVTLDKKSIKEVNGKTSFDLVVPEEMFAGADANGCITLQIGINAGQYAGNFNIRKHDNTPTPVQVCNIKKCGADEPKKDEKEEKEDPEEAVEEGSGDEPEKKDEAGESKTSKPTESGKKDEDEAPKGTGVFFPVAAKKPLTSKGGSLADEEEAKSSGSGSSTLITVHRCRPGHTDLHVCQGYFTDYLGKVEQWAQRHGETMGAQLWKACSLLSSVQHVPTMCCHQFHSTCKQFIQDQ